FTGPVAISPDGRHVAFMRESHADERRAPRFTLMIAKISSGEVVARAADLIPTSVAWAADSRSVFAAAEHRGRRPVFHVFLDGESCEDGEAGTLRLPSGDDSFGELCPSPDGRYLYALRSSLREAPTPVRITVSGGPVGKIIELPSPAEALEIPGTLT